MNFWSWLRGRPSTAVDPEILDEIERDTGLSAEDLDMHASSPHHDASDHVAEDAGLAPHELDQNPRHPGTTP